MKPADEGILSVDDHQRLVDAINALEPFANRSRIKVGRSAESGRLVVTMPLDDSARRRFFRRERFLLGVEVFRNSEGDYRPAYGTDVFASAGELRLLRRHCRIEWFDHMVRRKLAEVNYELRNERERERSAGHREVLRQLAASPRP